MTSSAFLIAASLLCWPSEAFAGPPLIADDPNTVGAGVFQPIFAASVLHQGDRTLLRGPILDFTAGVMDSWDVILVASLESSHGRAAVPAWQLSGLFMPGIKWRFLSNGRSSLAFTPAFGIDTRTQGDVFGVLPIQGEFALGETRSVIGFDVGYVPVRRGDDRWFVASYVRFAVNRRANVLGEIWCLGSGHAGAAADVGASFGVDHSIVGTELRLLTSLGTGVVSFRRPRVDVRAYLGIQYAFVAIRSGARMMKNGMPAN